MSKKKRTIMIVMLLLIIGGGIARYLVLQNNKSECEKDYEKCKRSLRAGADIICTRCDKTYR